MQIQGLNFTGFPGRDATSLRQLDYHGRVAWFRYRFDLVFARPLQRFVALESPECYVWLCVMNLVGSAVSSLADFAERGTDPDKFTHFVSRYMPTFAQADLLLHDPTTSGGSQAVTAAEHFYRFFRNGLAHDFCIQWGGLQHREETGTHGHNYLFEADQGVNGEHGLGIVPREFIADFTSACLTFITDLEQAVPGGATQRAFDRTFKRVYLRKTRPPLP